MVPQLPQQQADHGNHGGTDKRQAPQVTAAAPAPTSGPPELNSAAKRETRHAQQATAEAGEAALRHRHNKLNCS